MDRISLLAAVLLIFCIFVGIDGQMTVNPIAGLSPVGCPNYGLCTGNMYNTSLTYYQCIPGYCECNNGTSNNATLGTAGDCAEVADTCASSPCGSNGVCSPSINYYVCSCISPYTGAYCNETATSFDPCSSSPCQNGGTCKSSKGNATCSCSNKYTGAYCQYSNTCNSNPCKNGGTCQMLFNGAQSYCSCPSGYQGALCEVSSTTADDTSLGCYTYTKSKLSKCSSETNKQPSVDLCRSDFQTAAGKDNGLSYYCTYGGTCYFCDDNPYDGVSTSSGSGCTAKCSASVSGIGTSTSYSGASEICGSSSNGNQRVICYEYSDLVDPLVCTTTTCDNGGQCVDLAGNSTSCLCPVAYSGTFCDIENNPCDPNPCQNGGSCSNGTDFTYGCSCPAGYTGTTCQTKIKCSSSPCQYGSVCIDSADFSSYSCVCLSLYTGQNCDIPNMCISNPCVHGTCSVVSNSFDSTYQCTCEEGWTGPHCDVAIDFCSSEPCFYQGTCTTVSPPADPWYTCVCQPGTSGPSCEINPDDCIYTTTNKIKYSPCNTTDKQGQCIDGFNSYTCSCGPDYTSDDCTIPMIVWNATIIIFGEGATVGSDLISLLTDLLSNPANIADMVPFILGGDSVEERESFSYSFTDMFAWAAYEEHTLTLERDMYMWNDVTLGNCFTFNHRNNTQAQYLGRMTGRTGGLYAMLKINQAEYCPWIETSGIQVFVHAAEEDIFSESVRYNAQPVGETELFPSLTAYTRLGGRYGTCVHDATEVKQYYYTGAYDTDGCIRSCYQEAVQESCGCMDPRYPMAATATACSLTQRTCVNDIDALGDPSTWPSCVCPQACTQRVYDVDTFTRTIYSISPTQECSLTNNAANCTAGIQDTVRVAVTMTDYTYQLYAEVAAESFNSFIGSLGGLLGVLMGVSMISFIEIGFLFASIFVALSEKNKV